MDIDVFQAITSVVGDVTTIGVLLYWIHQCNKRYDALFLFVMDDWKRGNTRDEMKSLVDNQPITQVPER